MDDDTIIIKKADNGFVVKFVAYVWDEEKGELPTMRRAVLEEPENYSSEAERDAKTISKLLWWVTNHFEMGGSKHDSHRINIDITRQECD